VYVPVVDGDIDGDKFKTIISFSAVGVIDPLPPDKTGVEAPAGNDFWTIWIVATSEIEVAKYLNVMEPVIVESEEAESTVSETPTGSAFAIGWNVKLKIIETSNMALLRIPQIYSTYRKSLAATPSTFTLKISNRGLL
jgi:hypothetical protein